VHGYSPVLAGAGCGLIFVTGLIIAIPRTILAGGSIVLRPNSSEFVPHLRAAAAESIATIGRWMTWCHPELTENEAIEWYRSCEVSWDNGVGYEFSVFTPSGDFLGAAGLNQLNHANRFANLGYWTRESRQGRGYAADAARVLADFGLDTLKLNRVEIVAAEGNLPSRRVAEKVGARFEGVLRDRLVIHGLAYDAAMYSLTRNAGP
jgi:RimJ/RimL family protein N-acetyltransferase